MFGDSRAADGHCVREEGLKEEEEGKVYGPAAVFATVVR